MRKKIIIPYFHKGLKYTSVVLFAAAIYVATEGYVVWGIVMVFVGLLILTTQYVTEIDLGEKYYKDYLSLLWLPMNMEKGHFKSIGKIVIRNGNYSQTMRSRIQDRQLDWADFTATVLFDSDTSLDLLTRNEKTDLLKELKVFSDFLQVGVEDQTTAEHYWIDMDKV